MRWLRNVRVNMHERSPRDLRIRRFPSGNRVFTNVKTLGHGKGQTTPMRCLMRICDINNGSAVQVAVQCEEFAAAFGFI